MYFRWPYFYNTININEYEQMNNEMRFNNMNRSFGKRSSPEKKFSTEEAIFVAKYLNIKFDRFDIKQFRNGMDVELEHGNVDKFTNVTNDDPILTGKIALAHLNEFPDYYKRLNEMEEEAEKYWGEQT